MPSGGRAKTLELNELAKKQHGVVSRSQALHSGYSDSAIGRCIRDGLWRRAYRGVYVLDPTRATFETKVMALILRAPARTWASHRAAARLWGLDCEGRECVEVSTTANLRHPRRVIHHVDTMLLRDRRMIDGIPSTSVERTLVDLGSVVPPDRLEGTVVEALRRGLTQPDRLRERLAEDGRRFGPPRLRKLLDGWDDLTAAESILETRLRRLIRQQGLPSGIPQWKVVHGGRVVARVDLAYPKQMIAVEADGYRWHGDAARWRSDLARRNLLTGLGWRVLHFTWSDLRDRPGGVAEEIRAALDGAKPSFSPTAREKTTG